MLKKLFLILALMSGSAYGIDVSLLSHTGSYSGLMAKGLGLSNSDKTYSFDTLVGYTPMYIADEDLYQLTVRNTLSTGGWLAAYGGLGLSAALFDKDVFYVLPEKYPDGYYPQNGYIFIPYVGISYRYEIISLYMEVATTDYYAELLFRGKDKLHLNEASSLGFGMGVEIP